MTRQKGLNGDSRLEYFLANFDKRIEFCNGKVVFDSERGVGHTPNNANVRYLGFGVLMRPYKFLDLALTLPAEERRTGTIEHLPTIASTLGWGPPMLYIDLEKRQVIGHEGRHRATLFLNLCHEPILVHIFPRHYRARHIDREILDEVRDGLYKEGTRTRDAFSFVRGPLFDYAFVDDRIESWK